MSIVHTSLKNWYKQNPSDEKYFSYQSFTNQMHFFQHILPEIFNSKYEEAQLFLEKAKVIGEHCSKSINLPVVLFHLQPTVIMIVRCNFMNWKVSIKSDEDIDCDFMGLFDPNEKEKSVYCEGFQDSEVYEPYALNKNSFTLSLDSTYEFYTFLYILKNYFAKNS